MNKNPIQAANPANPKPETEVEYQLWMINRILTVWFEIENAKPIFE